MGSVFPFHMTLNFLGHLSLHLPLLISELANFVLGNHSAPVLPSQGLPSSFISSIKVSLDPILDCDVGWYSGIWFNESRVGQSWVPVHCLINLSNLTSKNDRNTNLVGHMIQFKSIHRSEAAYACWTRVRWLSSCLYTYKCTRILNGYRKDVFALYLHLQVHPSQVHHGSYCIWQCRLWSTNKWWQELTLFLNC